MCTKNPIVLIFFFLNKRPFNLCDAGELGWIPGLGRFSGEGNGNPLQHSCLENPMDGGAWWATLHGVTKSWTRCLFFHLFVKYTHTYKCIMYILVLDAFLWFLVCMTNVAVALKCTI